MDGSMVSRWVCAWRWWVEGVGVREGDEWMSMAFVRAMVGWRGWACNNLVSSGNFLLRL